MTDAMPTPMPPTIRKRNDLDVRRQRGSERADEEEQRRDLHHRDSADLVGDPTRGHGACRRAEERRGDGEAQLGVADAEVLLDGIDRAVDDGAVIAEQQTAQCGYRGDSNGRAAR